MSIRKQHYEEVLADYSNAAAAITLLKQHRPYLETLPSLRRPEDSVITIPLPVVRLRNHPVTAAAGVSNSVSETRCLPCDVAILMCDPEWKIKTGIEILVFIHRPEEDFSDLLSRWRQTQVFLSRDYEWEMPLRHKHVLSEGAEAIYPLFVAFEETPERIKRGLTGAYLPFVVRSTDSSLDDASLDHPTQTAVTDDRD